MKEDHIKNVSIVIEDAVTVFIAARIAFSIT
jgi:hypothetical protein